MLTHRDYDTFHGESELFAIAEIILRLAWCGMSQSTSSRVSPLASRVS